MRLQTLVLVYDFENRLVEARQSGTQTLIVSYRYDALGRRIEKMVQASGVTTRYILDGVQVVEEFDGTTGLWNARCVYEDGIDRPRCMDRADIADVNGNSNTTEVLRFHYHQQALGSVTEITQPSGAVVEWVTYDVYGKPTIRDRNGASISKSAVGNPHLFTGRELDPETGLFFYRARHYDAGTGRFLQRDPLGLVDGKGLYEYVRCDPARLIDPLGWGGAKYGTDNQKATSQGRTDRGQALLKQVLDIIKTYGSEKEQEMVAAAMKEYEITYFAKGHDGWTHEHQGCFNVTFGIKFSERTLNMEGLWKMVQIMLHELSHAKMAIARGGKMPANSEARILDESKARDAANGLTNIQDPMKKDKDTSGESAFDHAEADEVKRAEKEKSGRKHENKFGTYRSDAHEKKQATEGD